MNVLDAPQPLFTFEHPNRSKSYLYVFFIQYCLFFLLTILNCSPFYVIAKSSAFYFLDTVIDNSRYEAKEFHIPIDTIVHGFAGYFDCVLYKDVMLSTYRAINIYLGKITVLQV